MFPIRDDNPTILTPYVTYAIVGLNVVVWLLLQGLGMEPQLSRSICQLGFIPADFLQTVPAGTRLQLAPGSDCGLADSWAWYTPVTSMFTHGDWLHLIGNMWFLWIFGDNVESAMGHWRFVVFYLLSGLAAVALQTVSGPDSLVPMVGASGAIGGVMGAYVLLYPRVPVHMLIILGFIVTTIAVPAVLMLGYWFLIQLLSGMASSGAEGGVAFWAHVGGFVAGAVFVLIFRDKRLLARNPHCGWSGQSTANRPWRRVK